MTQGTEHELHQAAERFLGSLEARACVVGEGVNRQTGHKLVIFASRGRWNTFDYEYTIDGDPCDREAVLSLLRGERLGKEGTA